MNGIPSNTENLFMTRFLGVTLTTSTLKMMSGMLRTAVVTVDKEGSIKASS